MTTQQEALDTLNTLRDDIARRGLSDRKDLAAPDYYNILNQLDAVVDNIQALAPPKNCPNNWITCSCLHHLKVREAYAAAEREKELNRAAMSD